MTSEIKNRIIELCKKYKKENRLCLYTLVQNDIFKEYGVKYEPETLRGVSRLYRASNSLNENFEPINSISARETIEFNRDGTKTSDKVIEVGKGKELTEELLLKKHGFDPQRFSLVSAKNSNWQGQAKGRGTVDFYSSKITVKPKTDFSWNEENIERLFSNMFSSMKNAPLANPVSVDSKTNYSKNGLALIIPVVDLHYALKTYEECTGSHYGAYETESLFKTCIKDIISRTRQYKFEKIFFTIGCDMLNYDNLSFSTTAGTPQNGAMPIEVAIEKVTNMLIDAIEQLRTLSNVHVIHIPGNHDKVSGFGIANALRCFYSNVDDVVVDYQPIDRKYVVFGNTLLGFAHDVDIKRINDIVQCEARKLIGKTNKTVYFLSHYHHEEAFDKSGTDIRRLQAISSPSRWTYEKGLFAVRKMSSFIIDKDVGITDVLYTSLK